MEVIWTTFSMGFQNKQSVNSYFCDICLFADFIQKDILEATNEDAYRYMNMLINEHAKGKIRKSTVIKKYRELSRLYRYLEKNEAGFSGVHGITNIFEKVPTLEQQEIIPYERVLDVYTIDKLIGYLRENDTMTLMAVLFAFKMMLRMDEFRRLKVGDIIMNHEGEYGLRIFSKNEYRYNKIPQDMVECILEYVKDKQDDEYLFSKPNKNEVYTDRMLNNYLRNTFKKIECDTHYTFNNLRNTAIAFSRSNGADVEMIAATIGMRSTTHRKRLDSLKVSFNNAGDFVNILLEKRINIV